MKNEKYFIVIFVSCFVFCSPWVSYGNFAYPALRWIGRQVFNYYLKKVIIYSGEKIYELCFKENKIINIDMMTSPKRPVPETSIGEIKITLITNEGFLIELNFNKDEKCNEKIKTYTSKNDDEKSERLNLNSNEEEKVQINIY
jgi:hypothetical protein